MKAQYIIQAIRNRQSARATLAAWQNMPIQTRLAAIRARLEPGQGTSSYMVHGAPPLAKWRHARIQDPAFQLASVPCENDGKLFCEENSPEVASMLKSSDVSRTGGYYSDEFCSETIEARAVELRQFPGIYFEATLESMGGMLTVALDCPWPVDFSDCAGYDSAAWDARRETAKECIRAADSTAERAAEVEREYQAKWRAEQDLDEKREELKTLRHAIRALCHDLKSLCPSPMAASYPAAAMAVTDRLAELLAERREAMRECGKLREAMA